MMEQSLNAFKQVLQILALPVTAQVRLGSGERTCPEALIQAYRYWHQALLVDRPALSPEQQSLLVELSQKLGQLSPGVRQSAWSDRTLRMSADWRQVRHTARRALVSFRWQLAVPPLDSLVCPLANGDRPHLGWALR